MEIEIYYMSGAGNLFTVIDNRKYNFTQSELPGLAQKLCNLNFKTEGFLVIDKSTENDFSVLFFNPDGSSDMMCGNGGRCAIFFAGELDFFENKKNVTFDMSGEIYDGEFKNGLISLYLPPPNSFISGKSINVDEANIEYVFADVGSKHIVVDFDSLFADCNFDTTDISGIAAKLRYSKSFAPEGVNVNIFKTGSNSTQILLKTYEKGVEGITGACGTGAISTALNAVKNLNYSSPVKIIPPSGIPLEIDFKCTSDNISAIELRGHSEILEKKIIDV